METLPCWSEIVNLSRLFFNRMRVLIRVSLVLLMLSACARPFEFPRHSDRSDAGLNGPVQEMIRLDYEAVDTDTGLVAKYDEALVRTTCLFNESGTLLEQFVNMAPRAGGGEFRIFSVLDDQLRVVEQEGGNPIEQDYFKHFNAYEQGRLVRQVLWEEGLEVTYSYDEIRRVVKAVAMSFEESLLVWTKLQEYDKCGLLIYELIVDNKENKLSELKQEFNSENRLTLRVLGYPEGGEWVEEMTRYTYEGDWLIQEETAYVGRDFSVVTQYADFDEQGNWCYAAVRDHSGVPFQVSFRRFRYFNK